MAGNSPGMWRTLGSKAGVLYGAHKERENRARAGAAAKEGSSQSVGRGRWRRDSRKKRGTQAGGARDGPSAGGVVVEAREGQDALVRMSETLPEEGTEQRRIVRQRTPHTIMA